MFKPVLVHRVDVIEPAKDNDDNVESFEHDKDATAPTTHVEHASIQGRAWS